MDNGLPQSNGSALPINGLDQNVLEDGEVDDHEQEPSTTRTERSEKGPVRRPSRALSTYAYRHSRYNHLHSRGNNTKRSVRVIAEIR